MEKVAAPVHPVVGDLVRTEDQASRRVAGIADPGHVRQALAESQA